MSYLNKISVSVDPDEIEGGLQEFNDSDMPKYELCPNPIRIDISYKLILRDGVCLTIENVRKILIQFLNERLSQRERNLKRTRPDAILDVDACRSIYEAGIRQACVGNPSVLDISSKLRGDIRDLRDFAEAEQLGILVTLRRVVLI